jgi:hypothetical protein
MGMMERTLLWYNRSKADKGLGCRTVGRERWTATLDRVWNDGGRVVLGAGIEATLSNTGWCDWALA